MELWAKVRELVRIGAFRKLQPLSRETTLDEVISRMQKREKTFLNKRLEVRQASLLNKDKAQNGFISMNGKVGYTDNFVWKTMAKVQRNGHIDEEFDFDENEDVRLEDLKYFILQKKRVHKTSDIYRLACQKDGKTPLRSYLGQIATGSVQLQSQQMRPQDIKPIAISLVRDHRINVLDLTDNDLGPVGIMYVAEMMQENVGILDLNLSATKPGRDGLEVLAETLRNNSTLQILRLNSNQLEHTDIHLVTEILQHTKNLKELYLGHNELGFAGGKLLADAIAKTTTLTVLDLQWNHIRRECAVEISKAIGVNKSLKSINLSWNGWGKEGCIALSNSLPLNSSLVELNLISNRIDILSLKFLLHGLTKNKGLKTIELAQNPLTTNGAKMVLKAIKTVADCNITSVGLEGIPVDKEFTELLLELKNERYLNVRHGEEIHSGVALVEKVHDPHDLNRFDPVLVLVEFMRLDNLRLLDFFNFFDIHNREKLSKSDFRQGVSTLGIPLTEHHLDLVMEKIDKDKDGYVSREEFMVVHREVSRQVTQRTTKAKAKQKEDKGLVDLRKILKELIEKRNIANKEKARRMSQQWMSVVRKMSSSGVLAGSRRGSMTAHAADAEQKPQRRGSSMAEIVELASEKRRNSVTIPPSMPGGITDLQSPRQLNPLGKKRRNSTTVIPEKTHPAILGNILANMLVVPKNKKAEGKSPIGTGQSMQLIEEQGN